MRRHCFGRHCTVSEDRIDSMTKSSTSSLRDSIALRQLVPSSKPLSRRRTGVRINCLMGWSLGPGLGHVHSDTGICIHGATIASSKKPYASWVRMSVESGERERAQRAEHNRLVTVTGCDRDQDSLTTCAAQLFGALFAFPASSARSVARPGLFSSFSA